MNLATDPPEPNFVALRIELSRLRHDHKLTYDSMAELSGVSRRTLISIETGQSNGSLESWYYISKALKVELSELLKALDK
ncbi:helix-turn-helix transcriptional regulator [Aurantimicrobium minutum]|uniref:helix-turn-helix transcriptional regulator n=1 Tax=Aurantimicrobium minutum TaxID=708131 RepID=UPI00247DBD83|nr:putative transcriptional regulator [Aurantimicrobium minutum]